MSNVTFLMVIVGVFSGMNAGTALADEHRLHAISGIEISAPLGLNPSTFFGNQSADFGLTIGGYNSVKKMQYGKYSSAFLSELDNSNVLGSLSCKSFPEDPISKRNCKIPAWQVSGIAKLPLENGFSIYGQLGLRYWQESSSQEIDLLKFEARDIGATFGFGIDYEFRKNWHIHAVSEGFSELPLGLGEFDNPSQYLQKPRHSIGLSVKF